MKFMDVAGHGIPGKGLVKVSTGFVTPDQCYVAHHRPTGRGDIAGEQPTNWDFKRRCILYADAAWMKRLSMTWR